MSPGEALAIAVGLATCSCGACAQVVGPELQIEDALRAFESSGASFEVPGAGELAVTKVRFDRILVKPEAGGFTAVATVDAEGVLGAGGPAVSYLGLERIPFEKTGGRLAPRLVLLPALRDVLALLAARTAALEQADQAALERLAAQAWSDSRMPRAAMLATASERWRAQAPARPTAYRVRVDREQTEVLEERGALLQSRFVLRREGGQLRFASGLL